MQIQNQINKTIQKNTKVTPSKNSISNTTPVVSTNNDILLSQQELLNYSLDPYSLQSKVLNNIEQYSNNQNTVTSATTPFTLLLETMSMLGANALIESNALIRQKYLSLANDSEIVYFANEENYQYLTTKPAQALITFRIGVNSLQNQELTNNEYWETILPQNTVVSVLGKDFTLLNNISIKLFNNTGNQQVTNLSYLNQSNFIVQSRIVNDMRGDPYIEFDLELSQLYYNEYNYTLLNSEIFTEYLPYDNKFNSIKIYRILSNNQLYELPISFNNKYIDPNTLTVYVNVQNGILEINIPPCYLSLPTYPNKLFVEVYTTDGAIYLPLNTMNPSDFTITYNNKQVSTNIQNIVVYCFSSQVAYNEEKLVTFTDLKNNLKSQYDNIPITNEDILSYIETNGWELLEKTSNNYLVYKQLPYSISDNILSNPVSYTNIVPILLGNYGSTNENGDFTIDNTSYPNIIYFNNDYFLIKSGNVFKDNNGICTILSTQEINSLIPTTKNYNQVQAMFLANKHFTNKFYYYCNFNEADDLLIYDLDSPELDSLKIENINNAYFITNIQTYNITKLSSQPYYILTFSIIRSDGDLSLNDITTKFPNENIILQVRIPTLIEGQYIYFNSSYITIESNNGLPAYQVQIPINYNLTSNSIGIDKTKIQSWWLSEETQEVFISLQGTIDIYTMIKSSYNDDVDPFMQNEINHYDPQTGDIVNYKVFSKEQLNYNLGQEVTSLYNIFTSSTNTNEYAKYTKNVPVLASQNIYDSSSISFSTENNQVVCNITPAYTQGTQLQYDDILVFTTNNGTDYINTTNSNLTGVYNDINSTFIFNGVTYSVTKTPSTSGNYSCVISSNGNITLSIIELMYQYQINDPKLNCSLQSTIDQVNGITRYLPIEMIEYEYSKDIITSIYYKSNQDFVNKVLNQYLLNSLPTMNENILFGNSFKYYSRYNNKEVVFNGNISAPYLVSPNVVVYYKVKKNFQLASIKSVIGNLLQKYLCQNSINIEDIENNIVIALNDPTIVNVRVNNLLPDNHKFLQYTSLNRLNLKKILTLDVSGEFIVEYDINLQLITI